MPFITDEEVDEGLKSPDNLRNQLTIHEMSPRGRVSGATDIPVEIQRVVGIIRSETGESLQSLSDEFGIDKGSISRYSYGRTDSATLAPNPKLAVVLDRNKASRDTIEDKAIANALVAMGVVTERLPNVKNITTATKVLKEMVDVSERISGRATAQPNDQRQVHLHLYAPKQKSVDDYESVEV